MTDQLIIRIAEETTSLLKKVLPGDSASNVIPSYNALLAAAQKNHPDEPFLATLQPIERSESAVDLAILFSQLRIVIEAIGADSTRESQ